MKVLIIFLIHKTSDPGVQHVFFKLDQERSPGAHPVRPVGDKILKFF
jgi:hypothetical protein